MIIQDVSTNSTMWKIMRGYNERRLAVGLGCRRYDVNGWVDVGAQLEDAIIVPGSNVQAVRFWAEFQNPDNYTTGRTDQANDYSVFIRPPPADDYAGLKLVGDDPYIRESELFTWSEDAAATLPAGDFRFKTGTSSGVGRIKAGDIIGTWIIDDLLAYLGSLTYVCHPYGATVRTLAGLGSGWIAYRPPASQRIPCGDIFAQSEGAYYQDIGNQLAKEYYISPFGVDSITNAVRPAYTAYAFLFDNGGSGNLYGISGSFPIYLRHHIGVTELAAWSKCYSTAGLSGVRSFSNPNPPVYAPLQSAIVNELQLFSYPAVNAGGLLETSEAGILFPSLRANSPYRVLDVNCARLTGPGGNEFSLLGSFCVTKYVFSDRQP